MAFQNSDLAVRRHERYLCDLSAHVDVAPSSAGAVRLSPSAVGTTGRVAARVSDCSSGGLGIKSQVFFPLTACLKISVGFPGNPGRTLEALVRIQRVAMTDRRPTYYVGGAFEDLDETQRDAVSELMAALKASGAALMPEKSRA